MKYSFITSYNAFMLKELASSARFTLQDSKVIDERTLQNLI